MKNVHKLALASLVSLSLSSTAMAAQQPVAKLLQVSGKAFIENTDGKRQVAKQGMQITEGSHVVLLEKSKIIMNYISSNCRVVHQQNTLLTVQEAQQCGAGQPIAVGAAGAAAVPPKTIAVGKTAVIPPIMKGMGAGSGSLAGAGSLGLGAATGAASFLPILGLGGLGLLGAVAIANNDDDDDDGAAATPVSNFFDGNGNPVPVNAAGQPLDSSGNPVADNNTAGAGLFNADGAVVDPGGDLVTSFADGNGNPVPVNAAGQPLDSNGNPVTDNNTAGAGLFNTVGAVVDGGGDPVTNLFDASGDPVPVNSLGQPINAGGQAQAPNDSSGNPLFFTAAGEPVEFDNNGTPLGGGVGGNNGQGGGNGVDGNQGNGNGNDGGPASR